MTGRRFTEALALRVRSRKGVIARRALSTGVSLWISFHCIVESADDTGQVVCIQSTVLSCVALVRLIGGESSSAGSL